MNHPNKSAADVAARLAFFDAIANDLIHTIFPPSDVIFRGSRMAPLTDSYFLLNEAYKNWRITPGHRTKAAKIAALTCIAIATFEPFRPKTINLVTSPTFLKANEIFALTCALAILKNPNGIKGQFNRNIALRLFDIIGKSKSQTLEPFLVDLNLQIIKSSYIFNIHEDDKLSIDSLITIFELLEKQFDVAGVLSTL